MASNPPPFQVEDNTDEDFFDKLVNDDDDLDFNVNALQSASLGSLTTDGNESDDAKAFANLSINDQVNHSEINHEAISSSSNNANNSSMEIKNLELDNNVGTLEKSVHPLVSSNSFEFDNLVNEHEKENGVAERSSDVTVVSKSSNEDLSDTTVASNSGVGSGAPGVKEVDWSAFHADSAQNAGNGFGSYSDFFTEIEGASPGDAFDNVIGNSLDNGAQAAASSTDTHASSLVENSNTYAQNDGYNYGVAADQSAEVGDSSNSEYWENQYPGWKYDPTTGQWFQVGGYDAGASAVVNDNSNVSSTWGITEGHSGASYLQQSSQSVSGIVAERGTSESITNWSEADTTNSTTNWNQSSQASVGTTGVQSSWSQASQDNNGYPPHMVFDPQYPGWYYDTNDQEWRTLESYIASAQPTTDQIQDHMNQGGSATIDAYSQTNDQKNHNQVTYNSYDQGNSFTSQGFSNQGQHQNWALPGSVYNQQSTTMWKPNTVSSPGSSSMYSGSQLTESHYGQNFPVTSHGSQQSSVHYEPRHSYYESQSNNFPASSQSQSFVGQNLSQQINDFRVNQNEQKHASNDYYGSQNFTRFSQHQVQNSQISPAPAPGRSSAGRPAHALVSFGFGGKLIVMNNNSSSESLSFGSQNPAGSSVSVLNIAEVVKDNVDAQNRGMGVCNYFQALCQQSVPGPLTGGSVGAKELNKWIDDRIANANFAGVDYRKAEVLRLLLSLLKIACQYYGKLRSPYGTDAVLKENDAPESALARLFASAKSNGSQFGEYSAIAQCLQHMPSEGQMRVTAAEVQGLLVSGRKIEALQSAQEGQLWGPALVLAAQLGDQFYVETVKQMAVRQLVAGSPLRTLCLLIAGQQADVFSADSTVVNSMPGPANMPQQPAQFGANVMLDDWEENLAVIIANRTKDDERVLIHLGDCLWKDRSDIIAAHICYLVADASFEHYSDSARMCLVGADHWKFPRTYASPDAIQRTEIYEYSKTLGNSQFVLPSFQPYKLVYAHMLAEVGRVSDALKYSQAVLKSLKTGRTPEVETLRHLASSLEERIKAHQQGGFSTNLAPKKLVGKLLNLFDSTAHRVVGGLPPPVPNSMGAFQSNENHHHQSISTSQSTLAMSSLVPSSTEPISEWGTDSSKVSKHTRSVSEPDFGRKGQSDSLKDPGSTTMQDKSSGAGVTSRLGRFSFGSQLFQKTVGLVLKPRQGRQAKLGETNKFYYDEKLKRWVEEGSEAPAEEAALPPPPTTAVFQNGTSDYNLKSALQSEASYSNGSPEYKSPSLPDHNSGMPPLPPTSNQYSARGRMGVRSRYVDTFNRGGGNAANLFQSPSVPSAKPSSAANPKFFVPAPVSSTVERPVDAHAPMHIAQDTSSTYENSSPPSSASFQPPATPSSISMQRFASMNNISKGTDNHSSSFQSRRTASWSGSSFNNSFSPPHKGEVKPLGEVLGIDPSSLMPSDSVLAHSSTNSGGFSDDLHEVEL